MDEKADINLDKSSFQNMKFLWAIERFMIENKQWSRNDGEILMAPPKFQTFFYQFLLLKTKWFLLSLVTFKQSPVFQ
jgi:hypothetical protein